MFLEEKEVVYTFLLRKLKRHFPKRKILRNCHKISSYEAVWVKHYHVEY